MRCAVLGGAGWRLAALAFLMVAVAGCPAEVDKGFPSTGGAGGVGSGGSGGSGGGSAGTGGAGNSVGGAGGTVGGTGGTNGGTGGSGGDPVEPPTGSIPMFVAQGHAGRTIISCDEGRTWVADQSDEAWNYCSENDCDHGPGAGRGITWGDGWFFATFGWGSPGTVRRSRDGVAWESVRESDSFGGMAYGNDRLVAASRGGLHSDNHGDTWDDFTSVELVGWTVRDAAFVPYDSGRFIMTASDQVNEIVVSTDGDSWVQPQSAPAECGTGAYQGNITFGNGTIVMTGEGGVICRSTDGGQTWSSESAPGSPESNPVWKGSEFMAWSYGALYRSTDGQSWTTTQTVPNDIDVGVAAVSDQGTIVGVTNGWGQDYDSQMFYRSEDGVRWEVLPSEAYTGGHPIKVIAFGYGQPSEPCGR